MRSGHCCLCCLIFQYRVRHEETPIPNEDAVCFGGWVVEKTFDGPGAKDAPVGTKEQWDSAGDRGYVFPYLGSLPVLVPPRLERGQVQLAVPLHGDPIGFWQSRGSQLNGGELRVDPGRFNWHYELRRFR